VTDHTAALFGVTPDEVAAYAAQLGLTVSAVVARPQGLKNEGHTGTQRVIRATAEEGTLAVVYGLFTDRPGMPSDPSLLREVHEVPNG